MMKPNQSPAILLILEQHGPHGFKRFLGLNREKKKEKKEFFFPAHSNDSTHINTNNHPYRGKDENTSRPTNEFRNRYAHED